MHIASVPSSCGIPLALAGMMMVVVARPHAPPTGALERAAPAPVARRVSDTAPRSDGKGGYYVVAVVASIESEPINSIVDHVELCILDGERIGIETLRYTTYVPLPVRRGQAVLAHVAPGPVIGCEVPPGSSLLYLECVPRRFR